MPPAACRPPVLPGAASSCHRGGRRQTCREAIWSCRVAGWRRAVAAVKRPPRVQDSGWARIIRALAHIVGPSPGFPATTATPALHSGLLRLSSLSTEAEPRAFSSPGSLSRCFLPPLLGPASLSFKEPPTTTTNTRSSCSARPCPSLMEGSWGTKRCPQHSAECLSIPSVPSLRGCSVQDSAQCTVLSPICGAPFPSLLPTP